MGIVRTVVVEDPVGVPGVLRVGRCRDLRTVVWFFVFEVCRVEWFGV